MPQGEACFSAVVLLLSAASICLRIIDPPERTVDRLFFAEKAFFSMFLLAFSPVLLYKTCRNTRAGSRIRAEARA